MNFIVASPLRIVELVFDDPNRNAATIVLSVPVARIDLRQIRSVRQVFDRFENHRFGNADQQLVLLVQLFPALVAEKASILDEQRIFGMESQSCSTSFLSESPQPP